MTPRPRRRQFTLGARCRRQFRSRRSQRPRRNASATRRWSSCSSISRSWASSTAISAASRNIATPSPLPRAPQFRTTILSSAATLSGTANGVPRRRPNQSFQERATSALANSVYSGVSSHLLSASIKSRNRPALVANPTSSSGSSVHKIPARRPSLASRAPSRRRQTMPPRVLTDGGNSTPSVLERARPLHAQTAAANALRNSFVNCLPFSRYSLGHARLRSTIPFTAQHAARVSARADVSRIHRCKPPSPGSSRT